MFGSSFWGSAPFVNCLEKPDKDVKDISQEGVENNLENSCDHILKFRGFESSCQIVTPNFYLINGWLKSNMKKEKYGWLAIKKSRLNHSLFSLNRHNKEK